MIEQLRHEADIIEAILKAHTNDPPPTGEGDRLTRMIYIGALEDAAKTARSLADYLSKKSL